MILPSVKTSFESLFDVVWFSYISNSSLYFYILVKRSSFACREFLTNIDYYRTRVIHYNETLYLDLIVTYNSRKFFEPQNFHSFPQLVPRDIEFIRQDIDLENSQVFQDIKYIVEVEETVSYLETVAISLLYAMLACWLRKVCLLNLKGF